MCIRVPKGVMLCVREIRYARARKTIKVDGSRLLRLVEDVNLTWSDAAGSADKG